MSFLNNQDVQFELSNPMYYPDDSAPPIPNISVSHLDSEGAEHISATDTVSLVDDSYPRSSLRSPNAFMHYSGMPQTRTYSTDTRTVTTTGDHIFYSHLNVESTVPSFQVFDSDSLDTYFTELVPAVSGLHNISTHGLGTPIAHIHNAHHLDNSFAIQGVSNIPMPYLTVNPSVHHRERSFSSSGFTNSQDMSRDYHYIDFIIRVERKFLWGQYGKNRINFHLNSENQFQIVAETQPPDDNGNERYKVSGYHWRFDLSGDERVSDQEGHIFTGVISKDENSLPNESRYVFVVVRLDMTGNSYPRWIITDGEYVGTRAYVSGSRYTPQFTSPRVTMSSIFTLTGTEEGGDYNLPFSVQIVGYPNEANMPSLRTIGEEYIYPNPHEYAYSLFRGSPDIQYPFVIPTYSGNMWEHVNRVATGLPHIRNVG